MKRRAVLIILIFIIICCLIPIKSQLKDGGTIKYNAVLYGVTKSHSMWNENRESDGNFGYLTGTRVRVLWFTVYDDVEFVSAMS